MTDPTYELIQHLGDGAFGAVYLYKEIDTNCKYVAKFVKKEDTLHQEAYNKREERIKAEYIITKKLNHPNLISLRDFQNRPKEYVFIFDYCNKKSLAHFRETQPDRIVKQEIAFNLLKDIIEGYNYLNEFHVIHRDIKCENIFLTDENSNLTAKIGDFGLSKMLYLDETMTNIQADSSVGTLLYASPEILSGKKYNYQTDIFSIGVTYFVMLFGYFPFSNKEDKEEIYKNYSKGDITFRFKQDVSIYSIDFIMKCLQQEEARMNNNSMGKHELVKLSTIALMNYYYPAGGEDITLNLETYQITALKGYLVRQKY